MTKDELRKALRALGPRAARLADQPKTTEELKKDAAELGVLNDVIDRHHLCQRMGLEVDTELTNVELVQLGMQVGLSFR